MQLPKLIYRESPNWSERSAHVDLLVLHDCEGSYQSAINWFAERRSRVSAHFVLKEDGTEVTQMVPLSKKAWHCMAFNSRSVGLEMGGVEERGFPQIEWDNAAAVMAYLAYTMGVPVQWAKGGVGPGICRHFDLGKAGGGHSDPCRDDATWLAFMGRVKAVHDAGNFPAWGERR